MAIFGNFLSASGYNKSVSEELADRLEGQNWSVIRASNKTGKLYRLMDFVHRRALTKGTYMQGFLFTDFPNGCSVANAGI